MTDVTQTPGVLKPWEGRADWALSNPEAVAAEFAANGCLVVRGVFGEAQMTLLDRAAEARVRDPGPLSEWLFENVLYSVANSIADPLFETVIRDSPLADIVAAAFGGSEVWYENDQLWVKEGGAAARTTWHQDAAYDYFQGTRTAVAWTPLKPLKAANVLEVIQGSHRGPVYNGTRFDEEDPTAPIYEDASLPRMPDIEADRGAWKIAATDMDRGDVLVFHHASLHGGAPVFPGQSRRSFSFRFFGDDAVYRPRARRIQSDSVEFREANLSPGFEGLAPDEPIHHSPHFRRVRPWGD